MQCFTWLGLLAGAIMAMVSILRWFEQVTEAVEQRWWNKVVLLLCAPFAVWFFPSKVAAGRPTAVPLHEPVRGFGTVPLTPKSPGDAPRAAARTDDAPPGTPPEFRGLPKIPPKSKSTRAAVDPDKLAKLRQKMKEQGMIEDE
jgi:hypothetical protein